MSPMMTSTMSGLPIRTNSDKIMPGMICSPSRSSSIFDPKLMKKNKSRKSRRLVSLEPMASRYSVEPSDTPAKKAPISLLNPKKSPAAAKATAQAMENTTRSSGEEASRRRREGST